MHPCTVFQRVVGHAGLGNCRTLIFDVNLNGDGWVDFEDAYNPSFASYSVIL